MRSGRASDNFDPAICPESRRNSQPPNLLRLLPATSRNLKRRWTEDSLRVADVNEIVEPRADLSRRSLIGNQTNALTSKLILLNLQNELLGEIPDPILSRSVTSRM